MYHSAGGAQSDGTPDTEGVCIEIGDDPDVNVLLLKY